MTITQQRITCQDCRHVFDSELVTNAPIAVCIASMEAVFCPKCGSHKCGLGGAYDDAPPLTAPIAERAQWWWNRGDRGVSSETIFTAFAGGHARNLDVPHDPDDFQRCKQLLDLLPEWRADLGKVTARYPWFGPMIEAWGEIEALYLEEVEGGVAPKCYFRIKTAEMLCQGMRHA